MSELVLPRWFTPRTPGRPTFGPDVERAARALGYRCPDPACRARARALMPAQRLIADVAGEVLPNGRMAYPLVVVLLPRRGGKTALMQPTLTQRARGIPGGGTTIYTAQTRADASKKLIKEWFPRFSKLPPDLLKLRLSNGSEGVSFAGGGSLSVFAPTRDGVHGDDVDVACVDEAWKFPRLRGDEIMGAVRPAQLTRRMRQTWVISAGGDASSEWLLDLRELGRALTGPDQGLAYFEFHPPAHRVDDRWELDDGVDLESPELWATVHPAVGHTVDLEALVEDRRTFGADVFHRAYLNVFQLGTVERVLPALAWSECGDPDVAVDPDAGGLWLSYSVGDDSSSTSIVLAQYADDGRIVAELVDSRPGTAWAAARVVELLDRYRIPAPVADGTGPDSIVTAQLERDGRVVDKLDASDVARASSQLLDDVLTGKLTHRRSKALDASAGSTGRRQLGEGFKFTRRGAGDATPVIALSHASYRARTSVQARPEIAFA